MAEYDNNQQERASPMGSDYLTELIKSVTSSDAPPQKSEQSKEATAQASAPTSDILSAILSNPDLISKLPTIISTVKPILEMLGGATKASEPQTVPTAASSTEKEVFAPTKGGQDRRAALLCAMKPYLSHDRREAIDYIIKLSRLGDVLKSL